MAYIESHQTLPRHPKTRKAARLLGVSVPTVIGHLHCLWYWAMDYAQDGDLSRYDSAEIADASMWDGDPDEYLGALERSGFVDATVGPPLTYVLHEWMDYNGKHILKRKADAARKRADRLGLDVQVAQSSIDRDIHRTSSRHPADGAGTVPNLNVPNHTKPDQSRDGAPQADARSAPKPKSKQDELWDALVAEIGAPATQAERGKYNGALKQLRDINAKPSDIHVRCERYREEWPDVELTPMALVNNWSRFEQPRSNGQPRAAPKLTPAQQREAQILAESEERRRRRVVPNTIEWPGPS